MVFMWVWLCPLMLGDSCSITSAQGEFKYAWRASADESCGVYGGGDRSKACGHVQRPIAVGLADTEGGGRLAILGAIEYVESFRAKDHVIAFCDAKVLLDRRVILP
jgi:hypothetical protein